MQYMDIKIFYKDGSIKCYEDVSIVDKNFLVKTTKEIPSVRYVANTCKKMIAGKVLNNHIVVLQQKKLGEWVPINKFRPSEILKNDSVIRYTNIRKISASSIQEKAFWIKFNILNPIGLDQNRIKFNLKLKS